MSMISDAIENSRADQLEGHVLVGWALVAEWAGPDGTRSLTKYSGAPGGATIPEWTVKGWLHEALFGTWNTPPTE